MTPALETSWRYWNLDAWVLVSVAATATIYLRGALILRRRGDRRQRPARTLSFLAGLGCVLVALVSPLDWLAELSLSAHMIQHLLLMLLAPLLLWCGQPLRPLELGLPRPVLEVWLLPLKQSSVLRRLTAVLERPLVACLLFIAVMWGWHLPAAYQLALTSSGWHKFEHATLFAAGLVFWRPVVAFLGQEALRPKRALAPRPQAYWLLPYLFIADLAGTLLSAVLAFSNRVLYPHYAVLPPLVGSSALDDQAVAGGLMWVLGSLMLLPPLGWIGYRLLQDEPVWSSAPAPHRRLAARRDGVQALALAIVKSSAQIESQFDYARPERSMHLPANSVALEILKPREIRAAESDWKLVVWRALRSQGTQSVVRLSTLLLALLIAIDGFTGPQLAAMNLAGIVPWIHWRAFAVLSLLLLRNAVCRSCPLVLPRQLLRRWYLPRWSWPASLSNQWLTATLLTVFFLTYEVFDLWASPWSTAWIIVGYFVAATVIDSAFRGATFCNYVCPIGQFQCAQTHGLPIEPQTGGLQFALDRQSARFIQRFGRRWDVVALLTIFIFASYANALGMVAPVAQALDRIAATLAWPRRLLEGLGFMVVTTVLPAAALLAIGHFVRALSNTREAWSATLANLCLTLLPSAAAMWTAHYAFHFLAAPLSFLPAGQRTLRDWGWTGLPAPDWIFNCCAPVADGVLKFEILALDFGLLGSLYLAFQTASNLPVSWNRRAATFTLMASMIGGLFVLGLWIVFQPMEMRGMLSPGGDS